MEKGRIRRLAKPLTEEERKAEEFFIIDAEENTEEHIKAYKAHGSSFGGKYICSDLFKETYPLYSQNNESRQKYNLVVHNSAAVLANEMFNISVQDSSISKCIFLTGIPGGGKSFFIQSLMAYDVLSDDVMVYEGSIISPSIYEKLEAAKAAGKEIYIVIINPTIELAEQNVISRIQEIGRGATCEVMARIASGIPEAISQIHEKYPDITIAIVNKSNNYELNYSLGIQNIGDLYHGTYEEILAKVEYLRKRDLENLFNPVDESLVNNDSTLTEGEEDYDQKR